MTLLLLATFAPPAYACGGMFCNLAAPVDQAAERIVFGWEPDGDGSGNGIVTTEVQIAYTGESDDFAWVIPVSDVPELFTSNDAIFTTLANRTTPTYQLGYDSPSPFGLGCYADNALMSAKGDSADSEMGGVSVVATETVGPYDTVILQSSDSGTLITWLQDQGYDLPGNIEPVVQPYVAEGQYFVALKLSADRTTGDLAPLGMRYRGNAASIPIQLTSIAAVAGLPIEAFVLGPARAVPDNYLHVEINEAAIDWYNGGANYREVVGRAVDEAGGQAFVTEFSGSPEFLAGALWREGQINLGMLRVMPDAVDWLEGIVYSGVPGSSQLTALLIRFVPPPAGVDATDFLACPSCYRGEVSVPDWDPAVATDALETEIIDAHRDEQAMIDASPHLTRLFTTMDPSEMTADPIFVFNTELPQEVANNHFAIDRTYGARTLLLADGREIPLPASAELERLGETELEYMDALTSPAALVIADLGTEGEGEVFADFREQAEQDAARFGAGCGCTTSRRNGLLPGLLIGAGVILRRRRRR